MKMIGNGLRLIRVFFRLVFEMIRNYKKLNNDPDHNFLICKEICQKIVESAKIQLEIITNSEILNSVIEHGWIRDCSKRGTSKIGKLFARVKPPLFF